ncbi:DUF2510 domain-containing protein [Leifsonia shinshuensis]|uniref:DUF2510 domain-containing protein n=1 Tax=Leifsonia shinshuensis TaxID=150026 RepID=A0A853CVJ0_9MICO|nr:hypothetical protein [Leifsonia shinshuensis]
MSDANAPAGWYPDGQGQLRWWDGTAWTAHYAPLPSVPTVEQPHLISTEPPMSSQVSPLAGTTADAALSTHDDGLEAASVTAPVVREAKTRNGRVTVNGDTVTFTLRGKSRELSLHNIDAITYEPPGVWRNGAFRIFVTGDAAEPKGRYLDPWTIVLPGGPESMRDDWSDFHLWMLDAVAAARPKIPLAQAAARGEVVKPEATATLMREAKRERPEVVPPTSTALTVPAARSVGELDRQRTAALTPVAAERKSPREQRRDARELRKATEELEKRLASWRSDLSIAERALRFASDEKPSAAGAPVMLKAGETWWQSFPVQLIEDRVQTSWTSGHQGLSIPVAKIGGRSVRYSVGATKGHVDRTTVATAVDQGSLIVTSTRLLFLGQKQSRESLFAKLIGVDWPAPGQLAIAVSNRQKVTLLQYQPGYAFDLQMTITLAQADFTGRRDELIHELEQTVAQVRAAQPKLGG